MEKNPCGICTVQDVTDFLTIMSANDDELVQDQDEWL